MLSLGCFQENRHHPLSRQHGFYPDKICMCIPMCTPLEEFTGVNSSTSDLHRDLRSEYVRSRKYIKLFIDLFAVHPQFSSNYNYLIDASTGVVAAPNVNFNDTVEAGRASCSSKIGRGAIHRHQGEEG